MADFPSPLTPQECDLRGMDWMPLHGNRLIGSDFEALASDAEYRAAHKLWWSAWQQQVPAASLPDDDRVLAYLAGCGRDIKAWGKIKKMALHNFVKCSDGRLYHTFLAPEAIKAFANRKRSENKREADKERLTKWRENKKDTKDTGVHEAFGNEDETRFTTHDETRFNPVVKRIGPDLTLPNQTLPDQFNNPFDETHSRSSPGTELALSGEIPKPARKPRSSKPKPVEVDQVACGAIWSAYSDAYASRYGAQPVRNAKRNGQVRQLLARLGRDEAPGVAAFYVSVSDARIVRSMHDFGLLLANSEGYQTQWATGRRMTAATANFADRAQTVSNTNAEAMDIYNQIMESRRAGNP